MSERENTGMIPKPTTAMTAASDEKKLGYWGKIAKIYQYVYRGLIVALILFSVVFAVLFPSAFSYNGLRYFIEDLGAAVAIANDESPVLYYTYGEKETTSIAYHGGVALMHRKGVEIYQANGQRTLAVSLSMATPRVTVSRNYLVAFDLGGTTFSVCDAYSELYRGNTEFPIYGVTVSDAGYLAVITASDHALSQVLLYDGNYALIQRFYRSSATVSAAISDSGRHIALLGLNAQGGVLDLFVLGDADSIFTARFEDELPLTLGFTSAATVAVVTDRAMHTLHVDGRHYDTVSFAGQRPVYYHVDKDGGAVVLEEDAMRAQYRLISADKRGRVRQEQLLGADIKAFSVCDGALWLLSDRELCVYDGKGSTAYRYDVESGALGLSCISQESAYVFYGARAVKYSVAN